MISSSFGLFSLFLPPLFLPHFHVQGRLFGGDMAGSIGFMCRLRGVSSPSMVDDWVLGGLPRESLTMELVRYIAPSETLV